MLEALIAELETLEDPRREWRVENGLLDILVIAVCAVLGEAESFEDIALYGRCKRAWLESFLELPNGIPSHDTFRRVLMLVDPDAFERDTLAQLGLPREIVMRHRSPHFTHVFSGEGYAAGYYGYLWADVLTSDAAEAFEAAPGGYYDREPPPHARGPSGGRGYYDRDPYARPRDDYRGGGGGRPLSPRRPPPRREQRMKTPEADDYERRSIFCSQLANKLGQRDLGEFFEEHLGEGTVKDVRIVQDRITGRSKG